jgi:hypothetical protein
MLRAAGLTLAVLWAGWWTFFGAASSLGEGLGWVGVVLLGHWWRREWRPPAAG